MPAGLGNNIYSVLDSPNGCTRAGVLRLFNATANQIVIFLISSDQFSIDGREFAEPLAVATVR